MDEHDWQGTADSEAAGMRSSAVGDPQNDLNRLQEASAAALHSYSDLSGAPLIAEGISHSLPAPPQTDARSSQAVDKATMLAEQSKDAPAAALDSPVSALALHPQEASGKSKHLQRLEAAAARWQQRPGSSNLSSQNQKSDKQSSSNGFNVEIKENASLPGAQIWQTQQTDQGMESTHFAAGMDNQDPASERNAISLSVRSKYGDVPWYTSDAPLSVPPPPPTLPKQPQSKARASWWAALKGEAPPWLL